MGTSEELSNLLNGPSVDDFWSNMDVDGGYLQDVHWHPSPIQSRPPFEATLKPQLAHYNDLTFTTTSPYVTARTNVIGRLDSFGQNFLPPNPMEALPEAHPLSEPPIMEMLTRLSFQPAFVRGVDLNERLMSHHEADSANSSLETNFQLTDNLLTQREPGAMRGMSNQMLTAPTLTNSSVISTREFKPLDSTLFNGSKEVKVECGNLPTMLKFPFGSLPQMKPPILPKLRTSGSLLLCPPQLVDGSVWDTRPIGTLLGRSLSESRREERPSMQKCQSTSNISSMTRHSTSCSVLCNSHISAISKHPKKPMIGKLTPEERQLKIMRYKQKRSKRVFDRGVTYQCRKTLADRRPRVRGRFARSNDIHATYPNTPQAPLHDASESSQRTTLDVVRDL